MDVFLCRTHHWAVVAREKQAAVKQAIEPALKRVGEYAAGCEEKGADPFNKVIAGQNPAMLNRTSCFVGRRQYFNQLCTP
jgi:hypothetical protein